MRISQTGVTGQDYIELFMRRKWWLLLPLIAGTLIAAAYSYSIPPIYRSSTMILVERQRFPEGYVQPTVTSTVQERLNTIGQQITSRTNLERIIEQFDLASEESATGDQAGVVGRLLTPLSQQLTNLRNLMEVIAQLTQLTSPKRQEADDGSKDASAVRLENLINGMRNNIEVKVIGKDAFSIAYSGGDPTTAMNVTSTLASLFIEENLRVREQEAAETSKFLETESAEAERELAKRDKALKDFRATHMGSLPQQLDVNLRNLDHLRKELNSTNEALKNATDTLKDIEEGNFSSKKSDTEGKIDVKLNPLLAKREALIDELSRLRAEFNENYPDIVVVKKQINDIEAAIMDGSTSAHSSEQISVIQPQRLQSRVQALKVEMESLKEKQKKTISQVKEYERRVEDTFSNEQKLSNLIVDYNVAQNHYHQLLQKKLNAKSSENLEKWQKAERFRILDPANLPKKPHKPDRLKMILFGSMCGGGLGAGLILLREYRHPSFAKPEDFHGIVEVPTLVTIPRNKVGRRGGRQLVALHRVDSIMADQYRVLYTRISQLSRGQSHTVLAISSPVKSEGKTVTALNLAIVMARDFGKKTLLIEGDLKSPMLSHYLETKWTEGLVDVLLERSDLHCILVGVGHDNLSVLPAGKSLQNSSTLLSSPRMKGLIGTLREQYDIILIDSPPILPLPDMNIFEELVDSIILVVRAESTPRDAFVRAIDSLATQKLGGIVLNDVRRPPARYYRYDYTQA